MDGCRLRSGEITVDLHVHSGIRLLIKRQPCLPLYKYNSAIFLKFSLIKMLSCKQFYSETAQLLVRENPDNGSLYFYLSSYILFANSLLIE